MTPAPADPAALLARLRDPDDVSAPRDFAAAYLAPLTEFLLRRQPRADEHLLSQAAEDAILGLIRNPNSYRPEMGTLDGFLRMAAHRDLLNALEREARHHRGRVDSVGLDLPDGNEDVGGGDSDPPSFDDPRLAPVIAGFTDAERRVFDLMRQGEKATPVFAAALGITDRPADEQQAEVYRVKERIMQRLKRAGRGS